MERPGTTAALAIGGPAVMGAVLGMPAGVHGMLAQAATLPAILFGVALLTAPALYIATSLLGLAPPAGESLAAYVRALRASGLVLLGLAAPAAFLLATTAAPEGVDAVQGVREHAGIAIFAIATVGGAALAAYRKAWRDLFPRKDPVAAFAVFAAWALVTSLMGAKLLIDSFA